MIFRANVTTSIEQYCQSVALGAKKASFELACVSTEIKNRWLMACADEIEAQTARILQANSIDVEFARSSSLPDATIDRLTLSESRVKSLADAMREVARLPDPVGEIIESSTRPNGLEVEKVRVPLGVVFFIYEARPNVTADAAAICLKSGNAVILRGGKEAANSSKCLVALMQKIAASHGIPENALQLVEPSDRDAIDYFLSYSKWIDLAIPRGGKGLIERVVKQATMPVMKHYDGNCHVYVHEAADLAMALEILENSKCQRMGVCNACESLLVDRSIADRFLPMVQERLGRYPIEIRGDLEVCKSIPTAIPAREEDWRAEYLGPILSAKVVSGPEEAIEHINEFGSHHTDAIVTQDSIVAKVFAQRVDSAAVVLNASTRFNDGGEIGLGAEIGISTDKFHARGPCGLRELTSYKYVLRGKGQVRK